MGERLIRETDPYEMTPEEESRAEAAVEQAERDFEEMRRTGQWGFSEGSIPIEGPAAKAQPVEEARVIMQWNRAQLDVVRKAAGLFGISYQAYVKQAAFRTALDDLQKEGEEPARAARPRAARMWSSGEGHQVRRSQTGASAGGGTDPLADPLLGELRSFLKWIRQSIGGPSG